MSENACDKLHLLGELANRLAVLLGEKNGVDVGNDTTVGDGDVREKLVQLLVVADGQLDVARDDTDLLVVTSGVPSQLKDLSSQILENGSEVNGGTSSDTTSVAARLQLGVNTSNGELESCTSRAGGGGNSSLLSASSFLSRHDCKVI